MPRSYKGRDFKDIAELKAIMLTQTRPFARNLAVRIAEYAKGRKLAPSDFAIVEPLIAQSAKNEFHFRQLIISIATSELMTHR